ncbi:MAG: hypothetical protein JNL96_16990 [Planctomycetaceae bacterium]|nr:hypothetical protein [Planctomycetaceae bacterium]
MGTMKGVSLRSSKQPVEGVTMPSPKPYYVQECPTCGRKLNVRVEYLGKKVVCQHCRADFIAWDSDGAPSTPTIAATASLSGTKLLDRAQELIEQAEIKIAESRIIRARIESQDAVSTN